MRVLFLLSLVSLGGLLSPFSSAQGTESIVPSEILVLGPTGTGGRGIIAPDALHTRLVFGRWTAPKAGDSVLLSNGQKRSWERIVPNTEGWYEHRSLNGGWAYISVASSQSRIMVLEASGHSMVYVNGAPRGGDVYGYGYVRLPVLLRKGENELLFRGGRGRLRVRLAAADPPVFLDPTDSTLPDLHVESPDSAFGALVLVNATEREQRSLHIECSLRGGETATLPVPRVPPMSVRKVPFQIHGGLYEKPVTESATVRLLDGGREIHRTSVEIRVRGPKESYKQTFISGIDGSVQYYAVMPASADPVHKPHALVLSLHGASVEALGNVNAYASKPWAVIVSPTNRRPYGYDWEDWGRMDALEVLNNAYPLAFPKGFYSVERANDRVYLTGHSMGGHGTWNIGGLYPDLFGAIAPSAGWISAATYASRGHGDAPTSAVDKMLRRASSAGETRNLVRNYEGLGVYVLHGDADDNVPVSESRAMVGLLKEFHKDYQYHEQPGAGHWWESSDEPGAECMDWPPLFDFLARHTLPPAQGLRDVQFATWNPGISSQRGYATIDTQENSMEISTIRLRCDPHLRRFTGTTQNVRRLTLSLDSLVGNGPVTVELDGSRLDVSADGASALHLLKSFETWKVDVASSAEKNPGRSGPFREAFQRRMTFVYGTKGTDEETEWARNHARYDAETWWYRGNGAVDVVPDTEYAGLPDDNVILYGNADTNALWVRLLAGSPVQVRRGEVRSGDRIWKGNDLACLFVRPKPGSGVASVAVVSGTGSVGHRLTERLPYLQPMIGFPDLLVVGADALERGTDGIRCAGFFGPDWSVESGDFAYGG